MKWNEFFALEENKHLLDELNEFLDKEYSSYKIYPERKNVFNAFQMTEINNIKVVIIGQDPYHEPNQAMGLAFSVPSDEKMPPSLVNIKKEIENEYNILDFNEDGDLTYLSTQGVLLLNTILTVREHEPLSHNNKIYAKLNSNIMKLLDSLDQPIVFMLWGNNAKKYKKFLTNKNHLVLEATHPSPLGANKGGWFGCNHFKIANDFLSKNSIIPINWLKN